MTIRGIIAVWTAFLDRVTLDFGELVPHASRYLTIGHEQGRCTVSEFVRSIATRCASLSWNVTDELHNEFDCWRLKADADVPVYKWSSLVY